MKNKKIIIIILLLIVTLVFVNNYTYAKYVFNSAKEYYLKSKGFYFYSDNLELSEKEITNNYYSENNIKVNLKNYLNDSLITDYDIKYVAECNVIGESKEHVHCYLNNTENNKVNGTLKADKKCINNKDVVENIFTKKECIDAGYEFLNNKVDEELLMKVVVDEGFNYKNLNVKLEVTSTSPYSKRISAKYNLTKGVNTDNISLNYEDNETYGDLVITNSYNENKCVKIMFNSDNLRVDGNNFKEVFSSGNYINVFIVEIPRKNSLNYIFYKASLNDVYSLSEFQYEEVPC